MQLQKNLLAGINDSYKIDFIVELIKDKLILKIN